MKRALVLLFLVSMSADVRAKPVIASRALKSDIPLPTQIIESARHNRALFDRAKTSEEAFCAFVSDSISLLEPLQDAVTSDTTPPSADDDDSGAYGAETAGASVYAVEGGIHTGLQWKNVLSVASPASRPLVLAMRELGAGGFGAWIDQMTDYGGCHRPESALAALKQLAAAWPAAPSCLRDAFHENVVQTLTDMTEARCFCDDQEKRKTIQQHLAANAAVLSRMADIGAPFARKLRRLASQRDAHFGCTGPG
ncbi:MAG TPA: hypothetical protein VHM31_23875 [Polyangia bacterium]|nr:hypothetical protein [Polyangia bacterium]